MLEIQRTSQMNSPSLCWKCGPQSGARALMLPLSSWEPRKPQDFKYTKSRFGESPKGNYVLLTCLSPAFRDSPALTFRPACGLLDFSAFRVSSSIDFVCLSLEMIANELLGCRTLCCRCRTHNSLNKKNQRTMTIRAPSLS